MTKQSLNSKSLKRKYSKRNSLNREYSKKKSSKRKSLTSESSNDSKFFCILTYNTKFNFKAIFEDLLNNPISLSESEMENLINQESIRRSTI